jgi:hypothetical protein
MLKKQKLNQEKEKENRERKETKQKETRLGRRHWTSLHPHGGV